MAAFHSHMHMKHYFKKEKKNNNNSNSGKTILVFLVRNTSWKLQKS